MSISRASLRLLLLALSGACSTPRAAPDAHRTAETPVATPVTAPVAVGQTPVPPAPPAPALSCASPSPEIVPAGRLAPARAPRHEGSYGFFRLTREPPPARSGGDGPIELRLDVPATVAVNAALPLRLSVVNTSREAVRVLRPLDGSLEHMRTPHYDLYLRDESSGDLYRFGSVGARCGMTNPLGDDDIVTLAPAESRDDLPTGWSNFVEAKLPRRGSYSAWLVYSQCEATLTVETRPVDALVGVHASNAARFTVL